MTEPMIDVETPCACDEEGACQYHKSEAFNMKKEIHCLHKDNERLAGKSHANAELVQWYMIEVAKFGKVVEAGKEMRGVITTTDFIGKTAAVRKWNEALRELDEEEP